MAFALMFPAGCGKEKSVRHYEAPAEPVAMVDAPGQPRQGEMPRDAIHGGSAWTAPAVTWKAPEDWTKDARSAAVRGVLGGFVMRASGEEAGKAGVFAFPPNSGSDLDFSSVLTQQLGLPPLDAESIESAREIKKLNGKEFSIIKLSGGASGEHAENVALGAVHRAPEAVVFSLFFLPADRLESMLPAIEAFLGSFNVKAAPAVAAGGGSTGPEAVANAPLPEDVKWDAPDAWKRQADRAMRVATYLRSGDGEKRIELIVSKFGGDLGGEAVNVSRWRRQAGLPAQVPGTAGPAGKPFDAGGVKGTLYMFENADADKMNRVLWLKRSGQSWFFRFFGSAALGREVEGEIDQILRSIVFAD